MEIILLTPIYIVFFSTSPLESTSARHITSYEALPIQVPGSLFSLFKGCGNKGEAEGGDIEERLDRGLVVGGEEEAGAAGEITGAILVGPELMKDLKIKEIAIKSATEIVNRNNL